MSIFLCFALFIEFNKFRSFIVKGLFILYNLVWVFLNVESLIFSLYCKRSPGLWLCPFPKADDKFLYSSLPINFVENVFAKISCSDLLSYKSLFKFSNLGSFNLFNKDTFSFFCSK